MRVKTVLLVAVLALAAVLGWQAGNDEIANMEFQGDLHDLAVIPTSNWGYTTIKSDDDFVNAVIRKAKDHDIELTPDQVTIRHESRNPNAPLYLEAHYSEQVNIASFTMTLHFDPSSTKRFF